ncbi:MAG TPA: hypothetical protein VM843_03195 [Flavisolibacter sp.]|nr:hypothetical protein [Flavisolibacter sp.]
MKATSVFVLCALLFSTQKLTAQKAQSPIYFRSGKLTGAANISQTSTDKFNAQLSQSGGKTLALIQFEHLPGEDDRKALRAAGIELLSYIPEYAYTVAVSAPVTVAALKVARVKLLIPLSPQQKIATSLRNTLALGPVTKPGSIVVRVVYPKTFSSALVKEQLMGKGFEVVSDKLGNYHQLDIRLSANRLYELASSPYIEFVQEVPPAD